MMNTTAYRSLAWAVAFLAWVTLVYVAIILGSSQTPAQAQYGGGVPTTKEDCQNNGWTTFHNPDGSPMFNNQGDCLSFVVTHGKNEPGQNVPK